MSNGGMGGMADRAADKTNEELKNEELQMLLDTRVNFEDLRPQVSDQAAYDELIAAVDEATRTNNDLALLKSRLKTAGKASVEIFNKIKPFL